MDKKRLIAIALIAVSLTACRGSREMTPEEHQQVADLRKELGVLESEIAAAEEENKLYSGGLVKSLITVRLEVLRTTKALVEQRIHGIEAGAPVKVETVVAKPDLNRAEQLFNEITVQTTEVKNARAEAALYSGGLVAALKASTVATQEQTLAMLRQQYVMAKYGLVSPARSEEHEPVADTPSRSDPENSSETLEPGREQPERLLEIVEVDARATEANSVWTKYAWKLTVRNLSSQQLAMEATIEFQDREGFIVDDDREYSLVIGPQQEKTFTGYDLIDASVASNVSQVSAKVKAR